MDASRPPSALRVSVVIPVRDDAIQLAGCLAALARQDHAAAEIIVVDNASRDDSAAVARAAGARVMWCGTPGIPAAASAGYDAARGDVILRLDADCRPDPAWVATMLAALAAHPHAAAVSGGARFVDGPRALRAPLGALYLGAYLALGTVALGHAPLFGSNLAMRSDAWRDVAARIRRDDAELHDDLDLSYDLGARADVRWVRGAAMGMSMRPFGAGRGFGRRLRRGIRTVTSRWPGEFPPFRWGARVISALDAASAARRTRPARARPLAEPVALDVAVAP